QRALADQGERRERNPQPPPSSQRALGPVHGKVALVHGDDPSLLAQLVQSTRATIVAQETLRSGQFPTARAPRRLKERKRFSSVRGAGRAGAAFGKLSMKRFLLTVFLGAGALLAMYGSTPPHIAETQAVSGLPADPEGPRIVQQGKASYYADSFHG